MKKSSKWVVLGSIMVLPVLVYIIFVYSAKEVFFNTLNYVGPSEAILNSEGNFDTLRYSVPDWDMTNHLGEKFSSNDMKGNIYVANFFFSSCPSICGPMNFQVKEVVYDRFKGFENFKIVSFTVDPATDTVELLADYAKKLGAIPVDDNRLVWHFATGNREEIYNLANAMFVSAMVDESAPGGFLHSEMLVLIDWEGRIRCRFDDNGNLIGAYNSLEPISMKNLKEDISVLIAEFEKMKSIERKKEKQNDPNIRQR